ncbi:MAG TPA: hypothetical protein VIY48_13525, partial [Candidatus Paceibacterota bacterium]
ADDMSAVVGRLTTEELAKPTGRLESGVSLLNVFNYAVQVQAKRNDWNLDDFHAFLLAWRALDSIQPEQVVSQYAPKPKAVATPLPPQQPIVRQV